MVLDFQKDISLLPFNTFGIDVRSKKFIGIKSIDDLKTALIQNHDDQILVLGGGSNILLTKDFEAAYSGTTFAINGTFNAQDHEVNVVVRPYRLVGTGASSTVEPSIENEFALT